MSERGKEMWAIWNSFNGVFEVYDWRRDANDALSEGYSEHETVVPVRVVVEEEKRHELRHQYEDVRENMYASKSN